MKPANNRYDHMLPAEQALSILFKKLHPLLEDTDEALTQAFNENTDRSPLEINEGTDQSVRSDPACRRAN